MCICLLANLYVLANGRWIATQSLHQYQRYVDWHRTNILAQLSAVPSSTVNF